MSAKVKFRELTTRDTIKLFEIYSDREAMKYRRSKPMKTIEEIGYSIGRQFWGQGLGNEIVKTMVKAIEKKNEINKIVAWSNKENIGSIKILEKIGFKRISQVEHQDIFLYHKTRSKLKNNK